VSKGEASACNNGKFLSFSKEACQCCSVQSGHIIVEDESVSDTYVAVKKKKKR
jgi:hypothetical protein